MARMVVLLWFTVFFPCFLNAQSLQAPDFMAPVDLDIYLSGTFGELRADHFHSGIDIKTREETGHKLKMISNGYISRIKITPAGYGKAVYVTLKNGYTAVYGHLDHFNRTIEKYVRTLQFQKQSYEIDVTIEPYELYYLKGDIIAYSGNSGYSFGPHLHFEIRETDTQRPVNPLLFGFNVKDRIPPVIESLKIYDHSGIVPADSMLILRKSKSGYRLSHTDTIFWPSGFSFGVAAYDLLDGAANHNGIYSLAVQRNDSLVLCWKADYFSFSESRFINSLIDYREYVHTKRRFIKTRKDPFNELTLYKKIENNGIFYLTQGKTDKFQIEVSDLAGNISLVSFYVTADSNIRLQTPVYDIDTLLTPFQKISCKKDNLIVSFPEKATYDTIPFWVMPLLKEQNLPAFQIGYDEFPVHRYYSFYYDSLNISDSLKSKLVWTLREDDGFSYVTTRHKDGNVMAYAREFGDFHLQLDTIAPKIKWLNLHSGDTLTPGTKRIKANITDNLSEIASYDLFVNDKWVIGAYNSKNDELEYIIDKHLKKNKNKLQLVVTDGVGNRSESTITISYFD
jgi:hypothetical protein